MKKSSNLVLILSYNENLTVYLSDCYITLRNIERIIETYLQRIR